jgi:hypothetical protein
MGDATIRRDRTMAALALVDSITCEPTAERGGAVSGAAPQSATPTAVPVRGDAAHGCVYRFADGTVHLEYAASTRNILVFIQVEPAVTVSPSDGMQLAEDIADRQLTRLDR